MREGVGGGCFPLKRLLDFDVGLVILFFSAGFFYLLFTRYGLINVFTEAVEGKLLISLQVLPWMEFHWLRVQGWANFFASWAAKLKSFTGRTWPPGHSFAHAWFGTIVWNATDCYLYKS